MILFWVRKPEKHFDGGDKEKLGQVLENVEQTVPDSELAGR
jgi:hypothetical protein